MEENRPEDVKQVETEQLEVQDLTEQIKKERPPPAKQGKIIIRNLGFDLREKHLKACFGKFGKIIDSSVPLN